jgi:hypothetical protein
VSPSEAAAEPADHYRDISKVNSVIVCSGSAFAQIPRTSALSANRTVMRPVTAQPTGRAELADPGLDLGPLSP